MRLLKKINVLNYFFKRYKILTYWGAINEKIINDFRGKIPQILRNF